MIELNCIIVCLELVVSDHMHYKELSDKGHWHPQVLEDEQVQEIGLVLESKRL